MVDPTSNVFLLAMSIRDWAPTVFYLIATYYIYKQLRG